MKILDFQNNGLGDVVLGCWIIESAKHANEMVYVNPRNHYEITRMLNMPEENITNEAGGNWTQLPESGFNHELQRAHKVDLNRFEFWTHSLGLENLTPIRPNFTPDDHARNWAYDEWNKISHSDAPRIILLPEATRETRSWPMIYWLDLAEKLKHDYNVCVMALNAQVARRFDVYHFWGMPLNNFSAMLNQADLVISADSGGAHLAATLKTPVIALQGPTIGHVVFGHDEFAHPMHVSKEQVPCVACNFSKPHGYNPICDTGCQALYMLGPYEVLKKVRSLVPKGVMNATH
jgi:hypothetical protein